MALRKVAKKKAHHGTKVLPAHMLGKSLHKSAPKKKSSRKRSRRD